MSQPEHGSLPHYIIIGTQKGGTTSLYHYLTQHPLVAPAASKEVHYFDIHYERGVSWYMANFPNCDGQRRITGEASPFYLFHPHVPERVKALLPAVKLIVLLRNPVARAISSYRMMFNGGFERLSLEEALRLEWARIAEPWKTMLRDRRFFSTDVYHFSYLLRGIYAEQLQRWFRFFPRKQFLIIQSERFFKDTPSVYRETLHFLGLPEWEPPVYKVMNRGRGVGKIHSDTLRFLTEYYKPHNQRLYKLLGADFGW